MLSPPIAPIPSQPVSSSSLFSGLPVDQHVNDPDEVDKYLGTNFTYVPDNILEFWAARESEFPRLAKLASKIFALPSSTSCEEVNFSKLKYIADDTRTRLDPNIINDMFIIRSLLQLWCFYFAEFVFIALFC